MAKRKKVEKALAIRKKQKKKEKEMSTGKKTSERTEHVVEQTIMRLHFTVRETLKQPNLDKL